MQTDTITPSGAPVGDGPGRSGACTAGQGGRPGRSCRPGRRTSSGLRPSGRLARLFLREVGLVTLLLVLYNVGRLLAATRVSGAYRSAADLLADERWLHLPSEQSLQSIVLGLPDLTRLANLYYAYVHFPLTMLVLVWLFLTRPAHYLWARRALVAATGVGLLIMVVRPTAPPRMMTSYGFVDTGLAFGQSVYGTVGQDKLANQFAAMPSLHVGWALLVAVVCISASRTRWRWLWVAHPVVTLLVVVVTGNHYWLDAVVGVTLVSTALLLTRGALSSREGRARTRTVVAAGSTRSAAAV